MFKAGRRRVVRQLVALAGGGEERAVEALVDKLGEAHVRCLLEALQSRGEKGGCVPTPCSTHSPPLDAALRACRAFRWSDLVHLKDARSLPHCRHRPCFNPYHWSRLCNPETPPPPYSRFSMDDNLKHEDRAPCEDSRRTDHERETLLGSLTTDGEDKSSNVVWCRLAYWELGSRVGRLLPVEGTSLHVYGDLQSPSPSCTEEGVCITQLAQNVASSEPVQRTRAKIGLGLTLSAESDGVWVYNRSQFPVFVNSPTLDDTETRSLLVYRVPPGHCLCIFDPIRAQQRTTWTPYGSHPGPVDPNSVRISFAKGWGPKYSRQEVTACPCWLEVLLGPFR